MKSQQVGLTLIISSFLLSIGVYIVAYIPYKDIQLRLTSCVTNCPISNELSPTLYVSSMMIMIILIVGLFLFASKNE